MTSLEGAPRDGKVITFYSYKGGTGRSMALANVAWILASAGKRVIVLDWDLEAPGLHRYFRPFLLDKDLLNSPGVIDLMGDYCVNTAQYLSMVEPQVEENPDMPAKSVTLPDSWFIAQSDLIPYKTSLDWRFAPGGVLDFVPAGRQSPTYASRVNQFDWRLFYETYAGGKLLDVLRTSLCAQYDYVLIDSRTGVSDTSGICTIQLPDVLAVCFTLNNQSMQGAAGILDSVVRKRYGEAGDPSDQQRLAPPRPLKICPIPMRVPTGELQEAGNRRVYAHWKFDRFLTHLGSSERGSYWSDVEVLHYDAYALQEVLAPFVDRPGPLSSVLAACERITAKLTGDQVTKLADTPSDEVRARVLAEFAATEQTGSAETERDPEQRAEDTYVALQAGQQKEMRRLLTKLVYIVPGGQETSRQRPLSDLDIDPVILQRLKAAGIVIVDSTGSVELASDRILRNWTRLREWINADRSALATVEQCRTLAEEWRAHNRRTQYLLTGPKLSLAKLLEETRPDLFGKEEREFVHVSSRQQRRNRILTWSTIGAIILITAAVAVWMMRSLTSKNQTLETLTTARASPDPLVGVLVAQQLRGSDEPPGGLASAVQIAATRVPTVVLYGNTTPVVSATFTPDSKALVTASEDGMLRVWSASTGAENQDLNRAAGQSSTPVALQLSGPAILAAFNDGNVMRFTPGGGEYLTDPQIYTFDAKSRVQTLGCCAPDFSFSVAAGSMALILAKLGPKSNVLNVDPNVGVVSGLRYFSHGDRLIAAGERGIAMFGRYSGRSFAMGLPIAPVNAVDVRDDLILAGMQANSAKIIDSAGHELRSFALPDSCTAVAFSPDGTTIAAASNNTVYLFKREGNLLGLLKGHTARITDVRFSPDGSKILTASRDDTVRIWPTVPPGIDERSWGGILNSFGTLTISCLSPPQRQAFLKEDGLTATRNYTACEKSHGRDPLPASFWLKAPVAVQ